MPKKVTLVEFSELLQVALSLGYDWNAACDILREVLPWPESATRAWHKEDLKHYSLSADSMKIMLKAFEEFDTNEFHLTH